MLKQRRSIERLIALFLLGAIVFMPPVLEIFNRPGRVFGIPTLYLYIFFSWSGLIGVTLMITRRMRLDELTAAHHTSDMDSETSGAVSMDMSSDA